MKRTRGAKKESDEFDEDYYYKDDQPERTPKAKPKTT